MNNHFVRPVTCIGEDDRFMNMVNEWKSMKSDAMTSNHNTIMDQLKLKIEIQQATINELSSEMNEMKINFQVQSKLKDHELLNLRRRCEMCQNKVNGLEDNSSSIDQLKFDHLQNIFDMLIKENDSMKRKIKEFVTENDSLVSKLKGKLKHCPVVSFDYGNENCSKPKKLNISEKDGNEDVVDGTVQKVSNANEVQLVYINEKSTKIFEDNIDNKSSEKTIKTSIEIESNPLDKSRNDVICTEKNCCNMTAKHNGQSNIEDILKQDKNKTLTTTVNDNKKKPKPTFNELEARFQFNPICALQELCMSRGWQLPEYRFFEESDSKNFTYLVECTVRTFIVRVKSMIKKVAKRQAAFEMYQKIKMSEDKTTANKHKDNALFASSVVSSARFDEKPSMAIAIDNNGQKTTDADQVQLTQFTNESKNNNKHNISCISNKKTTGIDLEAKSPENNNSTLKEENVCKEDYKFTSHNELIAVHVQDQTKTVNTTENINKKKLTDQELEVRFKFNPICALQELCRSRNWTLPEYKIFEKGDNTYSVECTVLTFSVRVEGMLKKIAKRQAAIEMYHKIKNITSRKVLWANDVPEMKLEGNGIINDARVFTSAGFHSKPNIIDDKNHVKVNEDSFEICNKVVNQPVSLEEHGTDPLIVTSKVPRLSENHVPPVNEFVFVNEDKQSLFASVNADLAKILRLSNNPSLRKLKEMKSISKLTVPSNFELLQQIAEEEQLILNYEIIETWTLTMGKNFMGVQLMINDKALTVVGFGETLLEGQEEAAHECLTRFKSILKD